eukprot:GGOE01013184.1.p8 GENE.GGOE01013184.1~~GGOE01013184.1.p8  ORF type:complete len:103 (+),score=0.43 GGOE01013184.1:630-938(+)
MVRVGSKSNSKRTCCQAYHELAHEVVLNTILWEGGGVLAGWMGLYCPPCGWGCSCASSVEQEGGQKGEWQLRTEVMCAGVRCQRHQVFAVTAAGSKGDVRKV